MNGNTIGNDLADQLFDTEQTVDLTMGKAAKLLESMLHARRQLDLSAGAGQGAIRRVADSIAALGGVRGQMVAAHANLQELGEELGISITAGGGGSKPPTVMPEGGSFLRHEPAPQETV